MLCKTYEKITFIAIYFFIALSPESALASQGGQAEIPSILSAKDIDLYRKVFDLQEKGKWLKADRLIKKIKDKTLLGHLRFQRLMHPKKYRSKYAELAGWMKRYNDHPDAWRVYTLAKKRRGRARAPNRPAEMRYPGVTGQEAKSSPPAPKRNSVEKKAARKFQANVRRYARRGQPQRAEKRFWAIYPRNILSDHELATALAKISASYYYEGNDTKAKALATFGADLASNTVATNDWIAGLANYRLGQKKSSYDHFTSLTNSDASTEFLRAAAFFWAGRTAYQLGNPLVGENHLIESAKFSETFYGLIAAKQLGIQPNLNWSLPKFDGETKSRLLKIPAVRRALALAQIGREDLSDEELRLLWGRKGITVQNDLLALSAHMNLPAIQMRLGRVGGDGKATPTSVRYPLPDWTPADGFRLDKALIFGIVRQESVFRTRAKSSVGARGLMQVMPATARYLSRQNATLRKNRHRLSEPEFNMALGQQYVDYLSNMEDVQGNLLMLLAAYNAGPGTLVKWHKAVEYGYDPLLFIESIGFYETRDFIEKVMRNIWLYRYKLGQETPSLDALASGAWPPIENLDMPTMTQPITPKWQPHESTRND